MDDSVKSDLSALEKGIELIEMAHTSGLLLIPNGGGLKLQQDLDAVNYDKHQATTTAALLKNNSTAILAITADPNQTRELLAQSQLRMIEANEWLLTHLDLWHRLEQVYRAVSGDTECVMGAEGCRDLAIVRCKICVEEIDNGV